MAEITGVASAAAYERVAYEGRPGLVGLLSKNFFLTLITLRKLWRHQQPFLEHDTFFL